MQARGARGPRWGFTIVAFACTSAAMFLLASMALNPRWVVHNLPRTAICLAPLAPSQLGALPPPSRRCAAAGGGSSDATLPAAGAALDLELNPEWEALPTPLIDSSSSSLDTALSVAAPPSAEAATAAALGGDFLMVTFGNAAYFELMSNWVRTVEPLGLPYIIAAFDEETVTLCNQAGMPNMHVSFGNASFFRGDFKIFREMGGVKVDFVLQLMERHPQLDMVVVSDTDTVWLRDPREYMALHPAAEWFASTDCLSHKAEEAWLPTSDEPRCGHIPGHASGRAFNTGLFAARNRPAAKVMLERWRDALRDPSNEEFETRGIDDQLALNLIFEAGEFVSVPEDPRVVLVANQTLRVHPVPVILWANGHVAFIQRTPQKLGVVPFVIHTTFQRFGREGKRGRLREAGLWQMDPPEYYAGRFLTYRNDVRAFVQQLARDRYNGSMPFFLQNWVAAAYQLATLRDAWALALMTKRTLVVPTMSCYCDWDEIPHVLDVCKIRGTDLELPFECPLDYLLATQLLDSSHLPYRMAGFLEHPQVPMSLRRSRGAIEVVPSLEQHQQQQSAAGALGHAAVLWPGASQADVAAAVAPFQSLAVLEVRGMKPGLVAGFSSETESRALDLTWRLLTDTESMWCCATWGDVDEDKRMWPYPQPPPLAGGWQAWQAPEFELPGWCDEVSEKYGNRDFVLFRNHPCTFLRDPAAWQEASVEGFWRGGT